MNYNEFMDRLDLQSTAVAIAIVLVALALVLFLNRRGLTRRFREWRIQRNLDRIGSEQIRNLVCPDGLDGYYDIDRLALVQDAILIVAYKSYGGNIYCAERIAEWTQLVGQKSFKFENPLFELENQLASLRLQIGDVPLGAYLFFDPNAVFPKGHPQNVLLPEQIPAELLAENCAAPGPAVSAAWDVLKAMHQDGSSVREVGVKT